MRFASRQQRPFSRALFVDPTPHPPAVDAFQRAARRVPAYRTLLKDAGVSPETIHSLEDFQQRAPVVEKKDTFQRFSVAQLCVDGALGSLGSVLTSSGHSGIFAFGLSDTDALPDTPRWIDALLDQLFSVRSRRSLLINCLPMGVKIPTQACTLAETSVRPDMAIGLVRAFADHFEQFILVGETAFIKHLLELGKTAGIDWRSLRVHVIVGEEPLAENARKYLEGLLGHDPRAPERGFIFSSMGVAELGLNLFFEAPPIAPLISLRRALHDDRELRHAVLGACDWTPSLFTYDPRRIFVEFGAGKKLILTTLDPEARLPLIRYAPGDCGSVVTLSPDLRPRLEAAGVSWHALETIPIVAIEGRGDHALAGDAPVFPEAVKEGLYANAALVPHITANFRIVSGPHHARIRIQLSPGVGASSRLEQDFKHSIGNYVRAPFEVSCEPYETFGSGMTLDYERKFSYLGR